MLLALLEIQPKLYSHPSLNPVQLSVPAMNSLQVFHSEADQKLSHLSQHLLTKLNQLSQAQTPKKSNYATQSVVLATLLIAKLVKTHTDQEPSQSQDPLAFLRMLHTPQMVLLEKPQLVEHSKIQHVFFKTNLTQPSLKNVFQTLVHVPRPVVVVLESDPMPERQKTLTNITLNEFTFVKTYLNLLSPYLYILNLTDATIGI